MKTSIKPGTEPQRYYYLHHLENEDEMARLLEIAEQTLLPCPFCGKIHPEIQYTYVAEREDNYHQFCICCCSAMCMHYASDDPYDIDIKQAIYNCCQMWNKRPGSRIPDSPFPVVWQYSAVGFVKYKKYLTNPELGYRFEYVRDDSGRYDIMGYALAGQAKEPFLAADASPDFIFDEEKAKQIVEELNTRYAPEINSQTSSDC